MLNVESAIDRIRSLRERAQHNRNDHHHHVGNNRLSEIRDLYQSSRGQPNSGSAQRPASILRGSCDPRSSANGCSATKRARFDAGSDEERCARTSANGSKRGGFTHHRDASEDDDDCDHNRNVAPSRKSGGDFGSVDIDSILRNAREKDRVADEKRERNLDVRSKLADLRREVDASVKRVGVLKYAPDAHEASSPAPAAAAPTPASEAKAKPKRRSRAKY